MGRGGGAEGNSKIELFLKRSKREFGSETLHDFRSDFQTFFFGSEGEINEMTFALQNRYARVYRKCWSCFDICHLQKRGGVGDRIS